MKRYWILLGLVVLVGFSFPAIVIYNAIPHAPKPKLVYLNTDSMKEINVKSVFSGLGPSIITAYLCNKKNTVGDTSPWANVYICKSFNKTDSLSGDTLIALFDIKAAGRMLDTDGISQYDTGIEPAPKFRKCKVMVPLGVVSLLKRCRYKYGNVYFKGIDD